MFIFGYFSISFLKHIHRNLIFLLSETQLVEMSATSDPQVEAIEPAPELEGKTAATSTPKVVWPRGGWGRVNKFCEQRQCPAASDKKKEEAPLPPNEMHEGFDLSQTYAGLLAADNAARSLKSLCHKQDRNQVRLSKRLDNFERRMLEREREDIHG